MPAQKKQSDLLRKKDMPFLDHLEELRGVLLQCVVVVGVLAIGAWFVSEPVLRAITRPIGNVVFLSPTEAFTLRVKVSLLTGFLAALPFVLFKAWTFVAPGLVQTERRFLTIAVFGSTVLFLGGASFAYFALIPLALQFLLAFGGDYMVPMITATSYFGFVSKLTLALGIVFQLPLVVAFGTYAGVIQPQWLLKNWRYAIVIIAFLSAAITPPDIASQILVGGPVVGLYFLSAAVSLLIRRRKKEQEAASGESAEAGAET